MKTPAVCVPLLSGFEEIEATTLIDILRRANVHVLVAGDAPGPVLGSHQLGLVAEVALAEIASESLDMIVLPGGLPGARSLASHPHVQRLIREVYEQGGYAAAICAAPIALAAAGVHQGKTVTSYPGFEDELLGAKHSNDRVVIDGKIVTSRGPGTAIEFALALVELLEGSDVRNTLAKQLLV